MILPASSFSKIALDKRGLAVDSIESLHIVAPPKHIEQRHNNAQAVKTGMQVMQGKLLELSVCDHSTDD